MTDTPQRILPLPREEWTDAAREVFAFWGEPNAWEEGSKTTIIMTLANHPALASAYNIFGKHFLLNNSVPLRQLEIVVLRMAWLVKSEYEWHNHVGFALNHGLTLEEIAATITGPEAEIWTDEDRTILILVDELMETNRVSDETWAKLSAFYDRRQMMDLVFTVGFYVMTSWALSAFGVPIEGEADAIGFDLKTKSGRTPGAVYKPMETEDWISTRGY